LAEERVLRRDVFVRCAMVCAACGAGVAAGARFCAMCGAGVAAVAGQVSTEQVYAAQPMPVAGHYGVPVPYAPWPRVQANLQTLGVMWCVYAVYRVVAVAIAMLVFKVITLRTFGGPDWPLGHEFGAGAPEWLTGLLPVIAVVVVVEVALMVFTGWSLLQRKPWARTLSMVMAILALLRLPFGTALGIYTLWVMAPTDSGMEWEGIAERD